MKLFILLYLVHDACGMDIGLERTQQAETLVHRESTVLTTQVSNSAVMLSVVVVPGSDFVQVTSYDSRISWVSPVLPVKYR